MIRRYTQTQSPYSSTSSLGSTSTAPLRAWFGYVSFSFFEQHVYQRHPGHQQRSSERRKESPPTQHLLSTSTTDTKTKEGAYCTHNKQYLEGDSETRIRLLTSTLMILFLMRDCKNTHTSRTNRFCMYLSLMFSQLEMQFEM